MQINPSHNTQTFQVHRNHLDILQCKLHQQYLSAPYSTTPLSPPAPCTLHETTTLTHNAQLAIASLSILELDGRPGKPVCWSPCCLECDELGRGGGGLPLTSDSLQLHLRQRTAVHLHNSTPCVCFTRAPTSPSPLCGSRPRFTDGDHQKRSFRQPPCAFLKPRRGQQNSTVEAMM